MSLSVTNISTSAKNGGAAIAAFRLHGALQNHGVSSSMIIREPEVNEDGVIWPRSDLRTRGLYSRIGNRILNFELDIATRSKRSDLAYFSDDRVPGRNLLCELPKSNVFNLHWVSRFLDYRKFFSTLRKGQPLVWTLHDMAPMTGGCHYSMTCDNFNQACGACPLLGSLSSMDLTRRIHSRKQDSLQKLDPATTRIVAPSKWIADKARGSTLLRRFQVDVIPNCLDIEVFRPRNQRVARDVLGLPQDCQIVLFGADNVQDRRKGLDLLVSALNGINLPRHVALASIGGGSVTANFDSFSVGHIENPRLMSFVYSSADVFVLPTRADNLPNVLVEAMACGTPCVSFRVGGVPDVVRDGKTGFLADPEDAASLRYFIERILVDNALREQMSQAGRQAAVEDYCEKVIADRYVTLYRELIGASKVQKGNAPWLSNA